jgi:type IV conjugative transfer system protein TraE
MLNLNKHIELQRNILLGASAALLAANVLLSLKLYTSEVITRNLPITEAELIISDSYINDAALKTRADQILTLLFSLKKENISIVTDTLLRQVDNELYEEFKLKISNLAEDIQKRNYRYVFSDISSYEYENYKWTVKVTGVLDTYLSDKRIASTEKQYLLKFSNKSGIINLKSFEEIKNEQKD